MKPMKIKLKVNLPVDEKHGLRAGRVCEVVFERPHIDGAVRPLWFVTGDAGKPVGVWAREARVVEKPTTVPCPECTKPSTKYDPRYGWFCWNEDCGTSYFTPYPEPKGEDDAQDAG